jgi:N-acetylglucosamine-6-sulfatase
MMRKTSVKRQAVSSRSRAVSSRKSKKTSVLSSALYKFNRLPKIASAGLVVAVFALVGTLTFVVSHAQTNATASAAPLTKPNIVYILTDDQSMESVAKMPYVSSQTDWISFDKAYINNGLCCPSRATILSGQFDTHTGVGNNLQGKNLQEKELLPVWLQRAGYTTGMFGKYLNSYPFGRGNYVPAGWNNWQVVYNKAPYGIYSQYNYYLNNNGKSVFYGGSSNPANYMVNVEANKMVTFIKNQAKTGKPFFAEFTPTATHGPWTASPTRKNTMNNVPVTLPPNFNVVAANQPAYLKVQHVNTAATAISERRREYAAAASVDDAIKSIDDALKSAGVFNNTIEIFMTDNGFSFGDHQWERKRCEYNECGQTPMLIRYPGLAARHDTTHLVSNVDMATTISELAGATPTTPQDGMSFAQLILGQDIPTWRDSVLLHWPGGDEDGKSGQVTSMPQFWGVLSTADSGYWKYVEVDTGEKELYDENADPYEMNNLYNNPSYATVQADMLAKLQVLKTQAGAAPGSAAAKLNTDMPAPGIPGPDLD